MISFLLFLLLIFLIFVTFGYSILRWIFGGIFGIPKQNESKAYQNHEHTKNEHTNNQTTSSKQKKIIESDEGEYIDYEEIKD